EGDNSAQVVAAKSKYAALEREQQALVLSAGKLQKSVGALTPGMAAAADKAMSMGTKLQNAGEKISSLGSKATIGFTVPIVTAMGAATKSFINFDSQIKSMGALLDDGHTSASKLKSELNSLGDASKKWSVQYGVSTTQINDGMTEMIKKGYSFQQVMGGMPSILNATKASGDDFNDVMKVSTSTLEQFGLKSNNTATMLKNTQRVTDGLTYVANKTSAGFTDMGYAMEYVGPVAHGLNMSLEETSAAIGLMSNQGIEGQKAGTSLRGALSALLTPSKQNMEGFKALGVSVSDFKKGTLTLPDILDNIKAKSKGMTKQQLQSNLALAFGTEAQSGMNILVNEGGDALRKLTSETQNSTGYTKKLADTMNDTAKANVDKFKQSLNVLGIEAGQHLLPLVTEFLKHAKELIERFNNLDPATQK
ncbi:phage tail tape measure protein, partial [Lactiplantibacillus pentosus]